MKKSYNSNDAAFIKIKKLAKDLRASGLNYQQIADELKARGITTGNGKPYTRGGVHGLVLNPLKRRKPKRGRNKVKPAYSMPIEKKSGSISRIELLKYINRCGELSKEDRFALIELVLE